MKVFSMTKTSRLRRLKPLRPHTITKFRLPTTQTEKSTYLKKLKRRRRRSLVTAMAFGQSTMKRAVSEKLFTCLLEMVGTFKTFLSTVYFKGATFHKANRATPFHSIQFSKQTKDFAEEQARIIRLTKNGGRN